MMQSREVIKPPQTQDLMSSDVSDPSQPAVTELIALRLSESMRSSKVAFISVMLMGDGGSRIFASIDSFSSS